MPSPLEIALANSGPDGTAYARRVAGQYQDEPTDRVLREMQRGDTVIARARQMAKWRQEHPEGDESPSLMQAMQNWWKKLDLLKSQ